MKFVVLLFVATLFFATSVLAQVTSVQDGAWSSPSTWSSGVPGNNSDVVVAHQVHIDQNDQCRSMTINASGNLLNDGFTLRVDRNWTNNGSYIDTLGTINFETSFLGWLFGGTRTISGTNNFNNVNFTLNTFNLNGTTTLRGVLTFGVFGSLNINTGSLTLIASPDYHGRIGTVNLGTLNGTITSERYVGRCNEWSWYGGPFDATLSDYASASGGRMVFTGIPGSVAPTFNFVNAYFYDENWSSVGYTGYVIPSNVSDVVSRGTGFWYWNSDTVYSSGQSSIPQMWKMSLTGTTDISSTFNFSVKYTNTGNTAYDGWNFLGNPFPGTLDWDAGAWSTSGLDGALYTFNTCGQSYASYVGGVGTNGGTNLIPSYQGFHVKAIANSPSISTTAGALVSSDAALKSTNLLENILRIQLGQDEIVIRANDNATQVFNPGMDAVKFPGEYARIFSKNYGHNDEYSINTFNDSSAHVPLFTRGSGVLFFTEMETWESRYDLTLEDLSTGAMYDITPGFGIQYNNSDTVNFENRFVVHLFGGSELGLNEQDLSNEIKVLYDDTQLVVKSDYFNKPVQVQMVNMMGQVIYEGQHTLNSSGFRLERPDQVMILKIMDEKMNYSTKVR
ncbi:MAG: hypothetical protein KDC84_10145 [Crocinitomicaceae bacterium]|nr:hypothetical protein [Crocinitomicaceae bacterium]